MVVIWENVLHNISRNDGVSSQQLIFKRPTKIKVFGLYLKVFYTLEIVSKRVWGDFSRRQKEHTCTHEQRREGQREGKRI